MQRGLTCHHYEEDNFLSPPPLSLKIACSTRIPQFKHVSIKSRWKFNKELTRLTFATMTCAQDTLLSVVSGPLQLKWLKFQGRSLPVPWICTVAFWSTEWYLASVLMKWIHGYLGDTRDCDSGSWGEAQRGNQDPPYRTLKDVDTCSKSNYMIFIVQRSIKLWSKHSARESRLV